MAESFVKQPSAEDLRSAALWLESNEGDEAERAPMLRVAKWLESLAAAQELKKLIQEVARETGVPEAKVRAIMASKAAGHAVPAHKQSPSPSMVRQVACPACQAPPGARCVGARGQARAGCHVERWRSYREQPASTAGSASAQKPSR